MHGSGTLVVLSADCKGIVMRPGALRAATAKAAARLGKMRTRLSAGKKPNRKRMACRVTVYDAGPAERRPHDIIAPPGGRNGARRLRPGPKALAEWLAGSVRKDPAEVIAAAFGEAEARDPGHLRTWVVLVDGAEHQLDLIQAEAGRRNAGIHVVIDLVHVLEYIWKAAWSFHDAGDPAAEDWVAAKALAVLAGDSARAAEEITAQAGSASLRPARRAGADACVRYLSARHEYLRYDQALAGGWPIATGVIEGACRHLIADRLDISGARRGALRSRRYAISSMLTLRPAETTMPTTISSTKTPTSASPDKGALIPIACTTANVTTVLHMKTSPWAKLINSMMP